MTNLAFNVAQLLREEIGAQREYEFTEAALPLDDTLMLRDIAGRVRFIRSATGVVANITCGAVVRLVCVRSLEEFDHPLSLTIHEEMHSVVDVVTGVTLPKPVEEDPFFLTLAHMADIGTIIREYTLLELPLNPVCEAYRDHPVRYTVQSEGIDDETDDVVDKRFEVLKAWSDPSS
jgi:uncharacterized protein